MGTLEMEKGNPIQDMAAQGIWDCFLAKESALKLVGNCCLDVLRVDQIIMSRPRVDRNPRALTRTGTKIPSSGNPCLVFVELRHLSSLAACGCAVFNMRTWVKK